VPDRALRGCRVGISQYDFSRYILADINSDLISLYNIVKARTDEYVQGA
jgi:site-specific DNA-adenine methylase